MGKDPDEYIRVHGKREFQRTFRKSAEFDRVPNY